MPQSSEADARDAFVHWAALQPNAPRDSGALIQRIDRADDYTGLLITEIAGRRVVWRSTPCASKARLTMSAITLESIDPWNVEATALRVRSDHVAICDPCGGAAKVSCPACGGGGKTICTSCNGKRKEYGYAANGSYRLLNCTMCRGKGDVDCAHCRRGVAACPSCAGEGRVQRWIELETWRRTHSSAHPAAIARQFGWDEESTAAEIARDGEVVTDIDKPQGLTSSDLGNVPSQWLTQLAPSLKPGERIGHQHLRIVRIPMYAMQYRLGNDEDCITFAGRCFVAAPATRNAFTRRASTLRSLRWLLFIIFFVITVLTFGRGSFYWTRWTLASAVAYAAAFLAIYGAAVDWTALARRTAFWLVAAAICGGAAIALAYASLPSESHARNLIVAGDYAGAERELQILGSDAGAETWTALRMARIGESVQQQRWDEAANAILDARRNGVPAQKVQPLTDVLRDAAMNAIADAERESDAGRRLSMRRDAERLLVSWERTTDNWGTPPLIALRTSMARDLAIIEKGQRP